MAKAATVIRKMPVDPNAEREKELRELENALLENKDALTSVLSLLRKLEQTEALNIAHSLLDQKKPVVTSTCNETRRSSYHTGTKKYACYCAVTWVH